MGSKNVTNFNIVITDTHLNSDIHVRMKSYLVGLVLEDNLLLIFNGGTSKLLSIIMAI